MKLGGNSGGAKKRPNIKEVGGVGLQEMIDKATLWYEWTIKNEIEVHPHNDYVPREYLMKLHEWMYPYVYRMYETDNISLKQMKSFTDHCNELILDLRARCEEATWLYHWNEKGFIGRLKWRLKNKRLRKYDSRDFKGLCREARFVPYL